MTHPYTVTTRQQAGPLQTFHLYAVSGAAARLTAVELAGPGAVVVQCVREVEW